MPQHPELTLAERRDLFLKIRDARAKILAAGGDPERTVAFFNARLNEVAGFEDFEALSASIQNDPQTKKEDAARTGSPIPEQGTTAKILQLLASGATLGGLGDIQREAGEFAGLPTVVTGIRGKLLARLLSAGEDPVQQEARVDEQTRRARETLNKVRIPLLPGHRLFGGPTVGAGTATEAAGVLATAPLLGAAGVLPKTAGGFARLGAVEGAVAGGLEAPGTLRERLVPSVIGGAAGAAIGGAGGSLVNRLTRTSRNPQQLAAGLAQDIVERAGGRRPPEILAAAEKRLARTGSGRLIDEPEFVRTGLARALGDSDPDLNRIIQGEFGDLSAEIRLARQQIAESGGINPDQARKQVDEARAMIAREIDTAKPARAAQLDLDNRALMLGENFEKMGPAQIRQAFNSMNGPSQRSLFIASASNNLLETLGTKQPSRVFLDMIDNPAASERLRALYGANLDDMIRAARDTELRIQSAMASLPKTENSRGIAEEVIRKTGSGFGDKIVGLINKTIAFGVRALVGRTSVMGGQEVVERLLGPAAAQGRRQLLADVLSPAPSRVLLDPATRLPQLRSPLQSLADKDPTGLIARLLRGLAQDVTVVGGAGAGQAVGRQF